MYIQMTDSEIEKGVAIGECGKGFETSSTATTTKATDRDGSGSVAEKTKKRRWATSSMNKMLAVMDGEQNGGRCFSEKV